LVAALARAPTAPAYVRIDAPPPSPRASGRGGYGPAFGIVPGFAVEAETGVRVAGVRPGSPADQAGVRAGDVIVRFANMTVKTLEDLSFVLRRHRPGDRVRVTLARDGAEREVEAVLTERSQ
jgi:S1-C subfamily serine protease